MPIYLDNATTSFPKPDTVSDAVYDTIKNIGGSSGRGGHSMSYRLEKTLFETRKFIADLFNIEESKYIIFTSNATEAINIGLKGFLKSGDHVITSGIDHNAMIRPLEGLKQRIGISYTIVKCSSCGELTVKDIKDAIRKNTKLIALTHASNVVGTISPIYEIGELSLKTGISFMLDAAQTGGVIPIDVKKGNISILACTGHKGLMGPQGTGFLYARGDINLATLIEGGTGSASESDSQPEYLPDRFQSGTLNSPGIAGLNAGIKFITSKGINKIAEHELSLTARLIDGLKGIPDLEVYGLCDTKRQTPVVSFTIKGIDPAYIANTLDERFDIISRAGLHCAPHAHMSIGTFPQGTVRLSPGYFNTTDDIDFVADAVRRVV